MPVVTLSSDQPQIGRLAYVGVDKVRAGRVAGELMGRFLAERGGEVAIMSGLHSYIGHEEREQGFRAVIEGRFPACRLVAVVETREQDVRAGALTSELLRRHPDLAGIYNVSTGNRAIARALARLGLTRRIVVVTHELTAERRVLLKSGALDAIIDQNPELEAMTAVGLIAQHFGRREAPPGMGTIPLSIYLSENT
jgi:LacI family transcriptional regulator